MQRCCPVGQRPVGIGSGVEEHPGNVQIPASARHQQRRFARIVRRIELLFRGREQRTHDLGLIVVDEAHEVSFKQDDGVRYNARDVAVIRARFEQVPVILASATPALESLQLAEAGVYRKIDLAARYGGARRAGRMMP